jgi:hypothetical protein
MTKTLNKERINKSDNITEDKDKETRKRIKKVMISNKRRVMSSHSENIKKATDRKSQITNTTAAKNETVLEEQSIEKLL